VETNIPKEKIHHYWGHPTPEEMEKIRNSPHKDIILFGHFRYGIHKMYFLKDDQQQQSNNINNTANNNDDVKNGTQYSNGMDRNPPYSYACFFRNPVDRTISHYYYHKMSTTDKYHHYVLNKSLKEWVNESNAESYDIHLQFILGLGKQLLYYRMNGAFILNYILVGSYYNPEYQDHVKVPDPIIRHGWEYALPMGMHIIIIVMIYENNIHICK
jgi:hypothetical protein